MAPVIHTRVSLSVFQVSRGEKRECPPDLVLRWFFVQPKHIRFITLLFSFLSERALALFLPFALAFILFAFVSHVTPFSMPLYIGSCVHMDSAGKSSLTMLLTGPATTNFKLCASFPMPGVMTFIILIYQDKSDMRNP